MYIEPNTTIRILQNVPLDNTYKNTIYFSDATAQTSYFSSLTKFPLSAQSYQRKERGYMRIAVNAESLYNCNYLMYQNTSFGTKWFYAFITSVEYINNEVSEIGFEIDVMQTWLFDVTLKESFVEREHSETDVAGDNIVPETFTLGEYNFGPAVPTLLFNNFDAVIVSPYVYAVSGESGTWNKSQTLKTIDNNPSILCYQAFNSLNDTITGAVPSYIANALTQFPDQDDIVCIYLIPHSFVEYPSSQSEHTTLLSVNGVSEKTFEYYPTHPTYLPYDVPYIPKNKKLLTYPFNKLVIDTADGNLHEYAFEFFDEHSDGTTSIKFKVKGYKGINTCFKAVPIDYKGESENFTEGCILTDFPNVGFLTDSFKAWIAQNKTRVALQTVESVIGVSSGLGTVMAGQSMLTPKTGVLSKAGAKTMAQGYEQIGKSGVGGIMSTLAEGIDRSNLRYHPRTGSNDGSTEIAWGKKDFTGIQCCVNEQDALIIDDFFSVYGYATRRVKVPNRNVRPHWTYTKTIDCNLIGNAPADDVSKICSIYDNGITFWVNGSEVGDYSLDNSPTS